MDMWAQYRDAVLEVMPQAKIVVDKFHVVKLANAAIESVRKGLRSDLSPKERRGLMHDRYVLLKRESKLDDADLAKLARWIAAYPVLGQAYRLKEDFYAIYEVSQSKEEALQRYEAWHGSVTPELHPYFSDLIRAFGNWQPWILNYFDHPITNAYTESLNSLIRVMDRLGRGYSFKALRARMLFTEGAHKETFTRPKFERIKAKNISYSISGDTTPEQVNELAKLHEREIEIRSPRVHKKYGVDITTLVQLIESGKI
jgi:transposase